MGLETEVPGDRIAIFQYETDRLDRLMTSHTEIKNGVILT